MNPYTKTKFGNIRNKLLNFPNTNKITQAAPTCFWDFLGEYSLKYSFKNLQKTLQKPL
jgi:hypothetical protein